MRSRQCTDALSEQRAQRSFIRSVRSSTTYPESGMSTIDVSTVPTNQARITGASTMNRLLKRIETEFIPSPRSLLLLRTRLFFIRPMFASDEASLVLSVTAPRIWRIDPIPRVSPLMTMIAHVPFSECLVLFAFIEYSRHAAHIATPCA